MKQGTQAVKVTYPQVLGDFRTREEVLEEIRSKESVYREFVNLTEDFQNRFLEFCMGVRGLQVAYDPFFKWIFDAEVHPERLSEFLSVILGKTLTVKRMLPPEHRRISEMGSLLVMDILVEFDTGELADVEIQKMGYYFPGQRATCYASDMVMRQYEREKSRQGKKFSYRNLKKVYTIILMEESCKEVRDMREYYLHRGKCVFDTGLQMEILTEYFFIALDNFLEIVDNEDENKKLSELEAWLFFIGSDDPLHIQRLISQYPRFQEMYEEIITFRQHPEEAVRMFSDALRIMDENTVRYMVDDMKKEVEEAKKQAAEEVERAKKQAKARVEQAEARARQKAQQDVERAMLQIEEEKRKVEEEKRRAEEEKRKAVEQVEVEKKQAEAEVARLREQLAKLSK